MKKLLDELEVARDNADSIKEAQAVQLCINIVSAHNPWHEVGVMNASEKYWKVIRNEKTILSDDRNLAVWGDVYPAYNTEELLGMMKGALEIYRHPSENRTWQVCGEYGEPIYGSTLTEALRNKLIYDLENGIVSLGEVNK